MPRESPTVHRPRFRRAGACGVRALTHGTTTHLSGSVPMAPCRPQCRLLHTRAPALPSRGLVSGASGSSMHRGTGPGRARCHHGSLPTQMPAACTEALPETAGSRLQHAKYSIIPAGAQTGCRAVHTHPAGRCSMPARPASSTLGSWCTCWPRGPTSPTPSPAPLSRQAARQLQEGAVLSGV